MNQTDMFKFLYQNNLNNVYQTAKKYTLNQGIEYTLGMLGNINNGNKNAYDIILHNYKFTYNCNLNDQKASSISYDSQDQMTKMLPFKSKVRNPNISSFNNKINQNGDYFLLKISIDQYYNTPIDIYTPTFREQHYMSIGLTLDNTLTWDQGQSMYDLITFENDLYNIYFPTADTVTRSQNTLWFHCMNLYRYIDPSWRIGYPFNIASIQIYNEYINYWKNRGGIPTKYYIWGNCKNNTINTAALYNDNILYHGQKDYISPIPLYNAYLKEGIVWNPEIQMSDDDRDDAKQFMTISFIYNYIILQNEPNIIKEWLQSINI